MTSTAAGPALADRVRAAIREVPDFPRAGIVFRDISPVLGDGRLFAGVIAAMAEEARRLGVTHVAGVESRGFILGAPVAAALGVGFVPVRKAGKLPAATHRARYALEYGEAELELHRDACDHGARVLVVDDVLATGGTAAAACALMERTGASVAAVAVLIELAFLGGRTALHGREVRALVAYS